MTQQNIYDEHLLGKRFITQGRNQYGFINRIEYDNEGRPTAAHTVWFPYHIDTILLEHEGVEYTPIEYLKHIGVYKHD